MIKKLQAMVITLAVLSGCGGDDKKIYQMSGTDEEARQDISAIETDVTNVKADVGVNAADIAVLKSDALAFDGGLTSVESQVTNNETAIHQLSLNRTLLLFDQNDEVVGRVWDASWNRAFAQTQKGYLFEVRLASEIAALRYHVVLFNQLDCLGQAYFTTGVAEPGSPWYRNGYVFHPISSSSSGSYQDTSEITELPYYLPANSTSVTATVYSRKSGAFPGNCDNFRPDGLTLTAWPVYENDPLVTGYPNEHSQRFYVD